MTSAETDKRMESEQTMVDTLNRADFCTLYATLSPPLYGIISRLAKDESLSEVILEDVFVCFYRLGLLTKGQSLRPVLMFPIVFDCAAKVLAEKWPEHEIQDRILAERARMTNGRPAGCVLEDSGVTADGSLAEG